MFNNPVFHRPNRPPTIHNPFAAMLAQNKAPAGASTQGQVMTGQVQQALQQGQNVQSDESGQPFIQKPDGVIGNFVAPRAKALFANSTSTSGTPMFSVTPQVNSLNSLAEYMKQKGLTDFSDNDRRIVELMLQRRKQSQQQTQSDE